MHTNPSTPFHKSPIQKIKIKSTSVAQRSSLVNPNSFPAVTRPGVSQIAPHQSCSPALSTLILPVVSFNKDCRRSSQDSPVRVVLVSPPKSEDPGEATGRVLPPQTQTNHPPHYRRYQ